MSIVVTLEVDGQAVVVDDPSGGGCNAASDFDRLVPFAATFPMLRRIEPDASVQFSAAEMAAVSVEADQAVVLAAHERERRGLLRLRALAARGSANPGSSLCVVGD